MFFNYRAEPARLLKLFRLFRNQARRLRQYRVIYGVVLLAACLAYLFASLIMARLFKEFGHLFPPLVGMAALFLLFGWGLAVLFGTYPRQRRSPGGKAWIVIGLVAAGFFGLPTLAELIPAVLAVMDQPTNYRPLLGAWAWAGLGMFLASRWIVWLRLKSVYVEEFELDYLDGVLRPLLRDLPPDADCTLSCNPFPPAWTMAFQKDQRGAYIFHTYDDTLLEFKAKLDGDAGLTLRTLHRRIDKFKQGRKKLKDKGSKHRVAHCYRVEHPALASMNAKDGDRFRQLAARWQAESGGYASLLRREPAAGKLVVVQKKKFAASRDLAAGDLPPVALVLKTVRELSAFTTKVAAGG
ncbi:hypothetical protein [Methylomagnum sp.]